MRATRVPGGERAMTEPPPPPKPPWLRSDAPTGEPLPPPADAPAAEFLPSSRPEAAPSQRNDSSWRQVLIAAACAAVIAVAAVAFLGSRDRVDEDVATSSLPAGDAGSNDAAESDVAENDAAQDTASDAAVATEAGESDAPADNVDGDTAADSAATDVATDTADDTAVADDADEQDAGDSVAGAAASSDDAAATGTDATTADGESEPGAATDSGAEVGDDTASGASAATGDGTDDGARGGVEESRAVVRNGQIILLGAVPSQDVSDQIELLAAEVLGPDNVINEYVVDERAGDPNLGNITVEDTIRFEPDSARILPDGEPLLTQGLALLTLRPEMTIEIVGHTDDRGSGPDYNQQLSERRAESVKQWFVDRGVDPERLEARGAGQAEPIADNETTEGRRLNRRIQFILQNVLGGA